MNVELFSVFDSAAKRFMDPFVAPTMEFALRGFKEACSKPEHQFAMYPEDYCLYHVGTFDAEIGSCLQFEARKIAQASSYSKPEMSLDKLKSSLNAGVTPRDDGVIRDPRQLELEDEITT